MAKPQNLRSTWVDMYLWHISLSCDCPLSQGLAWVEPYLSDTSLCWVMCECTSVISTKKRLTSKIQVFVCRCFSVNDGDLPLLTCEWIVSCNNLKGITVFKHGAVIHALTVRGYCYIIHWLYKGIQFCLLHIKPFMALIWWTWLSICGSKKAIQCQYN